MIMVAKHNNVSRENSFLSTRRVNSYIRLTMTNIKYRNIYFKKYLKYMLKN